MRKNIIGEVSQQRITQHKRFVPDGTHLNFCFAKTSFMLGTLCEMLSRPEDHHLYLKKELP
jgi:hypothetical protein